MYRDMEQLQEAVVDPEDRAGMGRGRWGFGMPLIPVPIEWVKMSSKPSKWLFDVTTRTELERVFCRWICFQ